MKRILAILLSAVLVLGLAACGQSQGSNDPSTKEPAAPLQNTEDPGTEPAAQPAETDDGYARGNAVPAADTSFVVNENNLKYLTYQVTSSEGGDGYSYMQFSGLKDEDVMESVNKQIRDVFEELMDESYRSPYPGFAERVAELGLTEPESSYIGMNIEANYANILSVTLFRSDSYYSQELQDGAYSMDYRALNFDLNTGKQIRLADLLSDGTSLDVLSEQVRDYIADAESGKYYDGPLFTLNGDFTGVRPDQKYYINSFSGTPCLIFDYETPEFETDFQSLTVYTDTRGCSAFGQRFTSAQSLFKDETPVKYILSNDLDFDKNITDSYFLEQYFPGTAISCSVDSTGNEELPDAINAYTTITPEHVDEVMNEFKGIYDLYKDAYPEGLNGSVWFFTYASRFGQYVSVSNSMGRSIWNNTNYNNVYDNSVYQYYCFKGDSTTPLTIDDIFVPGADKKALIKKCYESNLKEDGYESVQYEDPAVLDQYFDEMIENINGIYINTEYVTLSYGSAQSTLIQKYFPQAESPWQFSGVCSTLPYSVLGCENLTIFD